MECDGYPYPLVPKINQQNEYNFYLPYQTNDGKYFGKLACSMYYHRSKVAKSNTATTTTATANSTATPAKPKPVDLDTNIPFVVICHGYQSWRNQMLLSFLSGGLHTTGGYNVVRFDFMCNGHSTCCSTASGSASSGDGAGGEDDDNDVCYYSNFNGEYDNLQTLIRYIQNELQSKVACIIGHSKSCYNVLKVASQASEQGEDKPNTIPCFVTMSGRYYIPNTYDITKRFDDPTVIEELNSGKGKVVVGKCGKRDCVITAEDIKQRNELDSKALVSSISNSNNAHVLTIHGTKDDLIPITDAYKFHDTLMPKDGNNHHELYIIDGADHNYNGLKYNKQLVATISNFIKKHYRKKVK